MALKKFCRCGKIIPQELKMCKECQEKIDRSNKKAYKDYKKNRRDIKEQKFYCSKEWIITRDTVKQRDKGLCKVCLSKGNIVYTDTIHHIEPLKEEWSKRLCMSNLISVCDRCHKRIHREYEKSIDCKIDEQKKLAELVRCGFDLDCMG